MQDPTNQGDRDSGSNFRCYECGGREFASLGEFERHQIEVHEDKTPNRNAPGDKQKSRNASDAVR